MESWGCCVPVFESSGEPVVCPGETLRDVPCSSGSEFVMRRNTFNEEVFGVSTSAPMKILSSIVVLVLANEGSVIDQSSC